VELFLYISITFALLFPSPAFSQTPEVIEASGVKYRLLQPVMSPEALEAFETLNENQKANFLKTRHWILKNLALTLMRLAPGQSTTFAVGGTIVGSSRPQNILGLLDDIQLSGASETLTAAEVRKQKIEILLDSVDIGLWHRAPLVAAQNEWGLAMMFGAQLQWGGVKKGQGGTFLFGLDIGYNSELGAVVFEFHRHSEVYSSGVVANAGLIWKIYPYMRHRASEPSPSTEGRAWYPPTPPMLGYGVEESNEYLAVGYTSTLGFPGEFSSVLNYVNRFERKTILTVYVPVNARALKKIANYTLTGFLGRHEPLGHTKRLMCSLRLGNPY
jgi:hypothetical protein